MKLLLPSVSTVFMLMLMHHALATPIDFQSAAQIPKEDMNSFLEYMNYKTVNGATYGVKDLIIKKILGRGAQSVTGLVEFRKRNAILKCDYHMKIMNTNIVKNEGKAYQKIYAAQKNKVPGSEYVVNTIASFPVKLNMAFVRKQYSQEAKELPNFFEDFFSEKGHCFITEYIQSETLRKYSTSLDGGDKRQKAIKLLPLMLQVLEGVKFLNSQGIAHRDLQPENILISNEQSGKRKATIIDFDSCENFDISKPPLATGSSNALIQYLPFEAVVGMQYNLLGVDSWQVGATFYEALAGVPPTTAVINAHNVHPGTEVSFILSNIIGKPFALPPVTNDPILRNAWKPLTDQLAPLLTIDPNKRSTVAGFLKDYRPASQGPPPPLPPR